MDPSNGHGSRESDPMLGSRHSLDTEEAGQEDRPIHTGKLPRDARPRWRSFPVALASLCLLSIFVLVGFVTFQFLQQQNTPTSPSNADNGNSGHAHDGSDPAGPVSELPLTTIATTTTTTAAVVVVATTTTASPSTTSTLTNTSTVTSSPATSASASPAAGILPPAEEFELKKTGFVVSDKPALREYAFNITRGNGAPDGLEKTMILVNGQSPGPLIEANTGDTVRVLVNNMLPSESTTIHWHGIDQRNSAWMDGVHGVTQCGIPPGKSFTYEFNLTDQRGSFWYHSHVSVQYTDGLYGPLIIHDPMEKVPPVDDDKIVMMGDLYHEPAEELLTEYLSESPSWSPGMPGMEPQPSNLIINGRHIMNCSAVSGAAASCNGGSRFSTRVKSGHRIRTRLISHSTNVPFWFSIDNHSLEIVEVDGVEVEPIRTTRVYLNPGQRYSVVFDANQTAGNYLMRAAAAKGCFHLSHGSTSSPSSGIPSINYQATGILSYDEINIDQPALGMPWDLQSKTNAGVGAEPWERDCRDLPFGLVKPARGRDAYPVGPRNFHYFQYKMRMDEGVWRTYVNDTKYMPLTDDATMWKVLSPAAASQDAPGNLTGLNFGPGQQVLVSEDTDQATQIVINSGHMMSHPWHLHGQNFQVVGWGKGPFGQEATEWNFENPIRRDTVTVPGFSHVVIRLVADNPGIWALHCHILWHAEGGMFIAIAQQMDKLWNMLKGLDATKTGGDGILGKFCSPASA